MFLTCPACEVVVVAALWLTPPLFAAAGLLDVTASAKMIVAINAGLENTVMVASSSSPLLWL